MDRNTIIGLVLIAAILIGYQLLNAPSKAEVERQRHMQDSLAALTIQQSEQAAAQAGRTDTVHTAMAATAEDPLVARLRADTTLTDSTRAARVDSVKRAVVTGRYGLFAPAAVGEPNSITLENSRLQITFNTKGARPIVIRLKDYKRYQGDPLLLQEPDSGLYEYRFFSGNLDVSTKDLYFTAEKLDSTGLRFKTPTTDPAKYLSITYRLDSAAWMVDVSAELVGLEKEVDPRNVMFHWELLGRNNEKHLPTEQRKCSVIYKYVTEDRNNLSESGDDTHKLEGRTNWVAFKQDFFTVAMIKADGFRANGSELAISRLPEDGPYTKRYSAKLFFDQEPSAHATIPMTLYLGPNQYNTLERTGVPQFERIVDLGPWIFRWMNRWLVIPIFNWLDGWGLNYGIIILVLTVVIKLILMPIAFRNQRSSARMRALRPEIDAINKKFPDQDDMMKRSQANMELYRKAGVSPAAGCVPMLLQLPILWAMFRFFPSSIELRQQHFLWADDLSSYDSVAHLPFAIPAYGNHVSLFTLLMAASTIIYSRITAKQMPQQQAGMPNMKLMMYLFPVMMLFFMNSLPAGLSYYYLLANLISILQMTVLSKFFIDEKKLRAELLANMSKPRKKSRWQQRIEEVQRQQQAARRR